MTSRPRQLPTNQEEDPIIDGIYSLHLTGNYLSYGDVRCTQTQFIDRIPHQQNYSPMVSWMDFSLAQTGNRGKNM
jgi:hypothetical protein